MQDERTMGVVVDGYFAGATLGVELAALGCDCAHVQSMPELLALLEPGFHPTQWRSRHIHAGDLATLVAELRAEGRPAFVAIGAHEGIAVADALAVVLDLPANGPQRTAWLLDKQLAAERLEAAGVTVPRTLPVRSVAEGLANARRLGAWPVVVKPSNSAGSDGVFICHDLDQVKAACVSQLGRRNVLDEVNTKLVVQAFVTGTAYATHSVTRHGHHFLHAVFEFRKRIGHTGRTVYDCFRLVPPSERAVWGPVGDYHLRCLEALDLRQGPLLGEVMLTAEGPRLIEVNARPAGAGTGSAAVLKRVLGFHQVSLYALSLCHEAAFYARSRQPVVQHGHVRFVAIDALVEGRMGSEAGLAAVAALPSFDSFVWRPQVGDPLTPSIDQMSLAALAVLSHADEAVVEADHRRIRELEKDDLFGLVPEHQLQQPGGAICAV